jgi:integral membrane protein
MKDNLKVFRIIAFSEGVSYLLLFAISMPLKYIYNMPEPNLVIGYLHGFLFVAYCIYALIIYKEYKWSFLTLIIVLIASLLPFGTFIAESKIFKKMVKN